jgi:hypothetical protein
MNLRPEPIKPPRRKHRLPQGNKSNRLMRRYYAALRKKEASP